MNNPHSRTIIAMTRNMPRLLVALAVALLGAAVLRQAAASDFPRAPRLAAGVGGEVLGGYQIVPGAEGSFELFTQPDPGEKIRQLGRFNGQLAGVAVNPKNRLLALTRDGSLGVYGDEPETLAIPDARWHMLALAWFGDGPVALQYDNGLMRLTRPQAPETWQESGEPVARDDKVAKAVLVPIGDELHVLWCGRAADLSRGALRHAVRRDGQWVELDPLPTGDVSSFTAFRRGGGLALIAVVPDPLGDRAPHIVAKHWSDGKWTNLQGLPVEVTQRLMNNGDFAGISSRNGHCLVLTAGPEGANLARMVSPPLFGTPPPEDNLGRFVDETQLVAGARSAFAWSEFLSLMLMAGFLVLLVLYCRRSRMISRMFPGRPPDLTSRAVALTVDWFLVSVAMAAYHFAAGDLRIYGELLTFGGMNEMFWINLSALAIFCAVMEGIYGRTPGKRLAGLRVRSLLGGPPTCIQSLIRNAMRGVDMFPVVFPGLLGAIAAILNIRRQRVGDILAATVVRRHAPLRFRKFILASASPRRRELLEALGLDFRTEPADIDEESIRGDTPENTARFLAEAKAKAAAERLTGAGEVVVAADTMVILDGQVLGKPKDAGDAARMLGMLSGRSHTVLTGVSVWDSATGQGMSDVEQTEVEFRELSQREIDDYVATGDPMDKAGAYGIQSGYLVKQVRGSLSNVAGLPMELLEGMLGALDS